MLDVGWKWQALVPNIKGGEATPLDLGEMEKLFPTRTGATDIPQREQWYLYKLCKAYFDRRQYSELGGCLDALDGSIKRYGEEGMSSAYNQVNKYMLLIHTQSFRIPPYAPYPLNAEVRMLRGQVALDLGKPQQAVNELQQARDIVDKTYRPLLERANEKTEEFDYLPYSAHIENYRVHLLLPVALYQNGEIEKSREVAKTFEALAFKEGAASLLRPTVEAAHNTSLLYLYMGTGNTKEALALIDEKDPNFKSDRLVSGAANIARTAVRALSNPLEAVFMPFVAMGAMQNPNSPSGKFRLAHLRTEVGRYADAKADLDGILDDGRFKAQGALYWVALYDRGRVAENEGQPEEAADYYRRAIDEIERQRSTINSEGARIGFFGDKQVAYQALIRLLVQTGKTEEAFLTTERAKARALVDMLANKQDFRVADADAENVRRLLAQQHAADDLFATGNAPPPEIEARLSTLTHTDPDKIDVGAVVTQVRNIKVETAGEIAALSPELASLVSVAKIDMADIRRNLPADATLVSYFQDKDKLYAFLVDGAGVKAFTLDRAGLEPDIESFRQAIEHEDAKTADLSRRLHARLIAPLVADIKTAKLVVAPHGALHYLPFTALSDGKSDLIDRYQVTFLPSASALQFVGKVKVDSKAGTLLALGDPDLGDVLYDLPYAGKEAVSVGALFPNSAVLLHKEASKQSLKEYGASFKYLHFATHGKFDPDNPLDSALMLAGDPIRKTQDRLTVSELYSMRLDADLVTLSACETGLGKVANGDDVVGLVRGFFYAGANHVVSTLWEIDDEATERLMVAFYRDVKAGEPPAQALRKAQIELRKLKPNPRYWAAFQITG